MHTEADPSSPPQPRLDPTRVPTILFLLSLVQCMIGELLYRFHIGPSILKSATGIFQTNIFFCHLLLAYFLFWQRNFARSHSRLFLIVVWLVGLGAELWAFPRPLGLFFRALALGGSLGLVGLGLCLGELHRPGARRRYLGALASLGLMPVAFLSGGWLVMMLPTSTSLVYDLHLHASDLAMYRALSPWLTWKMLDFPLVQKCFELVYELLGLCMVLVCLEFLARPQSFRQNPFIAFYLQGAVAVAFYSALPAVGSAVAFSGFPSLVPVQFSIQEVPWPGLEPRSCFPSMHVCWAFTCWSALQPLGAGIRSVAHLFLGLTLVSVFCVGNHYIVDVLAAFPVAVGVSCLARILAGPGPWRRLLGAAALLLLGTYLELLLIREGWRFWQGNGALLWLAFGALAAISVGLDRKLLQPGRVPASASEL